MNIHFLNDEERTVLNSLCDGTDVRSLSKERFLEQLSFSRATCEEADIAEILAQLDEKVRLLTDGVWMDIAASLPLSVPCDGTEEDMQ